METPGSILSNSLSKSGFELIASTQTISTDETRFNRPLFFRFRFDGVPKTNEVYDELNNLVTSFNGALKWKMKTAEQYSSFTIIPVIFDELYDPTMPFTKDYFYAKIGKKNTST